MFEALLSKRRNRQFDSEKIRRGQQSAHVFLCSEWIFMGSIVSMAFRKSEGGTRTSPLYYQEVE